MLIKFITIFKIFFHLLSHEIALMGRYMKDSLINSSIWAISNLVVSGYILPEFGVPQDFGNFQAASMIVSILSFELYAQIFSYIDDLETSQHILYYFTLPISNHMIFTRMVIMFTLNNLFLGTFMVAWARLLLWNQFALSQIFWPKFLFSLLLSSLFFAFFTIFLIAIVKNMKSINNILMRILFPLWSFGGFMFSVKVASKVHPLLGYVMFLSPYTFLNEATRFAMLGSNEFLPFWISASASIGFIITTAVVGYRLLRRKLDLL